MLRRIAAESTSFLIVNIVVSFLISLSCSPPGATAKHSDLITTLEQIGRLAEYSRRALWAANCSIKLL